jgi:hypothetical protein
MTHNELDHPGADDTTLAQPTAPPVPQASPKKDRRFTPKRLILISVFTLIGVVGGTLVTNALTNNDSSNLHGMGGWMSRYGSHYLSVSHDVPKVTLATDATSLRAACVTLQNDVGQAQSDPAMPLGSLESQWSVILPNLSTAANDCIKGVDQKDASLLRTAQNHMESASDAYLNLVKAVQHAGD